jgi:hypothetical protein
MHAFANGTAAKKWVVTWTPSSMHVKATGRIPKLSPGGWQCNLALLEYQW